MLNRIFLWLLVDGLAFLWLPLGAVASNCLVETHLSGQGATLTLHLGAGCTEQEREARAVDAAQLLQAFKEGKGIDLLGVVVRGDLSLDMVPVGPLPSELEGIKELQGREIRVIPGSLAIVDSVVRGTITHRSAQGLLVVKGPTTFSGTRFEQLVDLSRSVFIQPVTLSGAVFLQESYFVQGRFLRGMVADKTSFGPHTRFHRSLFQGPVTFQQARFNGLGEFLEVVFEKDVNLSRAYFKLGTGFPGAGFKAWRISLKSRSTVRRFLPLPSSMGTQTFARLGFVRRRIFPMPRSRAKTTFPKPRSIRVHSSPTRPDRRPYRHPQSVTMRSSSMRLSSFFWRSAHC